MAWLTPQFSIVDATSSEQDVYDVLVSNWGYRGLFPGLTDGLQFPPPGQPGIPTSISGMAIGPRSTVDRAWVTWNMQKIITDTSSTQAIRRLSLDNPLLFSLPAKKGTAPASTDHPQTVPADPLTAQKQGNLYLYPQSLGGADPGANWPAFEDSTVMPVEYLRATPDGAGSPVTLNLGAAAGASVFVAPLLHVILYLKTPVIPPPASRFPLVAHGQFLATSGTGAEVCVAQIPTYGRRHIVISMMSDGTASFRVGALRSLALNKGAGLSDIPQETTEASAAGVTKWIATRFPLERPNADYLLLYVTASAGAVNGQFNIAAYD